MFLLRGSSPVPECYPCAIIHSIEGLAEAILSTQYSSQLSAPAPRPVWSLSLLRLHWNSDLVCGSVTSYSGTDCSHGEADQNGQNGAAQPKEDGNTCRVHTAANRSREPTPPGLRYIRPLSPNANECTVVVQLQVLGQRCWRQYLPPEIFCECN